MNEEISRFPLNVICTKLNSQLQGDQNDVASAAPDTERTDSTTNYGTPFPKKFG
jgi:hypothetical protein